MPSRISPKIAPFATILLLTAIVGSCTFFRNFTTYFNVLYLAQWHLDQYESLVSAESSTQNGAIAAAYTHHWMEEELLSYEVRRKQGPPVIAFPLVCKPKTTILKGAASMHLDSAVILGSKVLAASKPTKYTEDALFIVGKALYYKSDYAGAKRKFYELLYRYPDTKYANETGMYLSESLVATGQADSATTSLEEILKKETSGDKELRSQIHKTFADLLVSSSYDNYERAADELKQAEEGISGNEFAQMEYDRGRLLFVTGHFDLAEQAFANAASATNDNTFQGEALSGEGEAQRRQKKYDAARQTFEQIVEKSRFAPTHPAANFELAYTVDMTERDAHAGELRSQSFIEQSFPRVRAAYFALDTMYRSTSQAVMARSRFRQAEIFREIGQYDSAARLANIIIGTKDFSTIEMNDYVNNRMRALSRFAEWKYQLVRIDTMERILGKMRRHPGMQQTIESELHNDAMKEYIGSKWSPGENYTVPPADEKRFNDIVERLRRQKASSGVNVFQIDFSDTARYIDSVHRTAARAHFEIGRAFESFDENDEAVSEYRKALSTTYYRNDTASMALQAQVLFSWVQLEHETGHPEVRDSLIGVLQKDFGETKYAQQAAIEYSGKRGKDSPGEIAYRNAGASLKTSSIEFVKPALLSIVAQYPREDVAPRALYTIGTYYEDGKKYDSALVYYSRVVKEYPFSRYAEYLKPKIAYALADIERRRTAVRPVQDTTKPVAPK
ncbi:MAG: tetratricopeptide repeat protein [Bacteroidetes bacterium]|nr:tetratricopeptide repeat protein [Bacteroidota bacterium]